MAAHYFVDIIGGWRCYRALFDGMLWHGDRRRSSDILLQSIVLLALQLRLCGCTLCCDVFVLTLRVQSVTF